MKSKKSDLKIKKRKKPKNLTFQVFLGFFKNLKRHRFGLGYSFRYFIDCLNGLLAFLVTVPQRCENAKEK